MCLTGSGAKPIAESLGVPFAQEVAANAIALQKKYEKVGTAIELGGQDAKMIFFKESETDPVSYTHLFLGAQLYGKVKYTICDGKVVYRG